MLQASIEPSIPERIENKDFRNKFEVLQDERDRMQDEVDDAERIMKRLDDEPEDVQSEESDTTSQPEKENMTAETEQPEKTATEPDTAGSEQMSEENDEEEDPVITDPEVQSEEIKLDLGGDEKDNTSPVNSQDNTDTAEEPNQMENQQTSGEPSIQDESSATATYYIIGGSFRQKANAIELRDELAEEGFDPVIIEKEDSDMMFVTYRGYDDLGTAKSALADIRQYQNSDAWLYLVR